jgi:hypothetical protein
LALLATILLAMPASAADVGNRLTYLDEFCDPYYAGLDCAKFVTPQWVGDDGVELVVVLAIDDLRDPDVYEKSLRPVFERLKQVDGRAPVSMMTNRADPADARLQGWLKEGVNLEAHTFDHPCPCLGQSNFKQSKATYDRAIDMLAGVPNTRTVAFRMPCCDSMNSASPRFYAEIFNKTTPEGRFLSLDSSIFMLMTANDPALPRDLVRQEDGRPRFAKYLPTARKFVNYVEDYPYPYVIAKLCWEMPTAVPDDWMGNDYHQPRNPLTVRDMKAAIDATAIKQGAYTLTFHPYTHNWILTSQVLELVNHALDRYGRKVKFLNFREVYDRITQNALGGQPLRAANGQDNGVRLLDLNNDGYMDVVIGNEKVRQTRIWSPEKRQWVVGDFPVAIVSVDAQGNRRDAGVRFGVLDKSGRASLVVRNENAAAVFHFDGNRWVADPRGLYLEADGPVMTAIAGRDRGARLVDLDRDGICELVVANEKQNAVFRWSANGNSQWQRLPFGLPVGTAIINVQGGDAGCRLVDIDEDGRRDVVFSSAERYSLHIFSSMADGWSREVRAGKRGDAKEIPPIVRADGSNNGVWFKYRQVHIQNEDVGSDVQLKGKPVRIPSDAREYATLLDGGV